MKKLITDLELQYRLKKQKEEEIVSNKNKYKATIEDDTLVLLLAHEDAEVSNYEEPETLAFTLEAVTD